MTVNLRNNICSFLRQHHDTIIVATVMFAILGLALLWRLLCGNQSSRYYALFYFLTVPALAAVIFYLPVVPVKIKRGLLIIACLIFAGKTLHFNPYDLHMQQACKVIRQEVAKDPSAVVVNYAGKERDLRLKYYLGAHVDTVQLTPPYFPNSFVSVLPGLLKSSAARDYQLILLAKVSRSVRAELLNMLPEYPECKCIFQSPVNRSKKSYLMVFSVGKNRHILDRSQYADSILSPQEYLLPPNTSKVDSNMTSAVTANKTAKNAISAGWSFGVIDPDVCFPGLFTLHPGEAASSFELQLQDKGGNIAMLLKWLPAGNYLVEIEGRTMGNSDLNIGLTPWADRSHALPRQTCFVKHFREATDFQEYFPVSTAYIGAAEFTLFFQVNGNITIKRISISPEKPRM